MYGQTWPTTAVYGNVWADMAMYAHTLPCMTRRADVLPCLNLSHPITPLVFSLHLGEKVLPVLDLARLPEKSSLYLSFDFLLLQ